MKRGLKHLIECHCVLPQYRLDANPPYHKFVVFSVLDEQDNVIPKCVRCNNCGVVHRVTDILKSEIALGNESDAAVVSIDDIRFSLPQSVIQVMEAYHCDLPTWEQAAFLLETRQWGSQIILTSENVDDTRRGKYMVLTGPGTIKIESYSSKTSI